MRTMLPLRALAICSNVAFIIYGYFGHLYPVLILHCFLLPLNILRLFQIRALIKDVRDAATSEFSLEWLLPHIKKTSYGKGAIIFHKGDLADRMLYVHSGRIQVTDIDGAAQAKVLGPGTVLGEIGIFAPERKRTANAVAAEDTDVYGIDQDKVIELYYQNPRLAFYLVKLITHRLVKYLPKEEERTQAIASGAEAQG
jgi:CRP-like cAMP-binding protein